MKKLLFFIAMVLMTLGVMAQSNVISYQAVVRDAQNRLATNEAVTVTVQVLDASDVLLYSETESVISNANGLISLTIGDGNPTDFAAINWTGAKFKTTVKITSSGYEVENTIPVTSVPLSVYASDVDPSGSALTAVYAKIKADSTTVHSALVDSAADIRTSMATMNTNLQNGIDQNKQAIIDTAAHIRNEISDLTNNMTAADNALSARIVADSNKLVEFKAKVKADSTTLHNAIIDTASNIRSSMATMNTNLQNGIDQNKQAIIDTASNIRSSMATMNTNLQNGIDQNKQAIIDTASNIRSEVNTKLADYTKTADLPTTIAGQLSDTANNVRNEIKNAKLTIQTNGVTSGTFTANQGTDQTINIDVPAAQVNSDWTATSGAAEILNKPTAVSAFTNDANYVDNTACSTVSFCDLVNRVLALEANQASMQHTIDSLEDVIDAIQDNLTVPTVTTTETVTNITGSKATVEGAVVSEGTSAVTARGICYNTTGSPVATGDHMASGTGEGTFTCNLTGLAANTTYHFRAYATNAAGTTYGEEYTFTTLAPSLSVSADYDSPCTICGATGEVTYSVSMENDDISIYTLQWYVNDLEQTGETGKTFVATHTNTDNYVVKCTATRTGASVDGTKSMDITLTLSDSPSIVTEVHLGNTGADFGKVKILSTDASTIEWYYEDKLLGNWTSGMTDVLPAGNIKAVLSYIGGCTLNEYVEIKASPVCVPQTAINTTLEEIYTVGNLQLVKTIKDHENNVYNVVQIGTRCWTRENMRAVTSPTTGTYLINTAYSTQVNKSAGWVNGDSLNYWIYGVQYNFCAAADYYLTGYADVEEISERSNTAMAGSPYGHAYPPVIPTTNVRGVCPEGWHIAVAANFSNLYSIFPNKGQHAGGETGVWASSTIDGAPGNYAYEQRNISGFSALPNGLLNTTPDSQTLVGDYALFWVTDMGDGNIYHTDSHRMVGFYKDGDVINQRYYNHGKEAVRCIRNNE